MTSRFIVIWTFLLFTCTPQSFAQSTRQVQGKITDSAHNPVSAVSLKLFVPGSKDTMHTLSGKKGNFSFSQVSSPAFTIVVTSAEFEIYEKDYQFDKTTTDIQLGELILRPDFKLLKNVEVTVSSIVIKEDTIEYKAALFNVKEDASVEDILKKLPGIEVSKNGAVTAQGKPIYKVKVNGKDFFGSDVKMATRELPANIIDKIQVIDDYGEAAAKSGIKTDEPVKIINLQLKKDKSTGVFGNATAGYGSSNSYQAKLSTNLFADRSQLSIFGNSNNINNGYVITGKANTGISGMVPMGNTGSNVNPGIKQNNSGIPDGITTTHAAGVNYRADFGRMNTFYGSYNFVNRNTEGFREQISQYIYPAGSFINDQHYDYTNGGNNHQLYLNLELHPDSMSYLKISPELFFNNIKNINTSDFSYSTDAYKTSEGFIKDSGKMKMPNIGVHILYNRYFHKQGRNLSLSLNPSSLQSNSETYRPSFSRIYNTQGGYKDSSQDQQILQTNRGYNYSFSFAYTEPISKGSYLDLTYLHDFSKSNNDRSVYLRDSGSNVYRFNANLSDEFANRYLSTNMGLNFRTIRKKYNYAIGISLLPVNSKNYSDEKDSLNNQRRTLNVSPVARFSYTFSRSKNLSISYRGNTRQPGTAQLQPVRDISNPQFQKEGNPDLRSEFSHSLNMSYNSFSFAAGSSLFSTLGMNAVQNKIVNNNILLDSSGAQLSRPENVTGFYNINGFYTYSKAFHKNMYVIKSNGSFSYNHDAILVNSKRENGNNWFLSQGLGLTYKNNKWLEFGIEAFYTHTATRDLINQANNSNSSSWTFSNDLTIDLPYNFVVKYDLEIILNQGLAASLNQNTTLLNVSVEKKLLKKKSLYLSFAGYNILKQNFSLSRQVNGNSIIDTRTLQIARYFIFTLTYRWNKFGKQKG